jgi:hypothetical protein
MIFCDHCLAEVGRNFQLTAEAVATPPFQSAMGNQQSAMKTKCAKLTPP